MPPSHNQTVQCCDNYYSIIRSSTCIIFSSALALPAINWRLISGPMMGWPFTSSRSSSTSRWSPVMPFLYRSANASEHSYYSTSS